MNNYFLKRDLDTFGVCLVWDGQMVYARHQSTDKVFDCCMANTLEKASQAMNRFENDFNNICSAMC